MSVEGRIRAFVAKPENVAKAIVILWLIFIGMMVLGYLIMAYILFFK